MALISISKIQNVLPEFVDTRIMPNVSAISKWLVGGGTFLILRQSDVLVNKYLPALKQVGLVNENNQLDIELAKGFINSAFEKSGEIPFMGLLFDRHDGEALIGIMEKYRDETNDSI